ncbi:hypothetical protein [Lewinella sp. LCG006]|uniref:hypothetical protein n=1 Tax=Lewinella sp. LCG006 TaxID=3231911 RepID=UPI00345FF70D
MKFSEALLIVKEFFLEVLGFLIPGLIFVFILSVTLNDKILNEVSVKIDGSYQAPLLILIAYVLGYIIYGASEFRDSIFSGKIYYGWCVLKWYKKHQPDKDWSLQSFEAFQDNLYKKIKEGEAWKLSNQLLRVHLKNFDYQINERVRDVRNLLMSYISESDNTKIYTFTFRADLCRHLSTVFIFYVILGGVLFFSARLKPLLACNQNSCILTFCFILVIFTIFLGKTRRRFYSIAIRVPFSMFTAYLTKAKQDEE